MTTGCARMEYNLLSGTDLRVPRIGLGCNKIAAPKSADQLRAVEAVLRAAIERGVNFLDTANVYGDGLADRMIRNAVGSERSKIVLCSKAGHASADQARRWHHLMRRLARRLPLRGTLAKAVSRSAAGPTFTLAYIEKAIEGSLQRLGTDYLDLFLLHNPEQVVLWRDDLFEALGRLKRQGKIRYYGVSLNNPASTEDWLAWLAIPGISAVQVLVNPLRSVDLTRLVPAARERNIGIIARQPFHKGALLTDRRFLEIAAANPLYTPSQMALQFSLGEDGVDMVLAGFRSMAHLEDNLGALTGPGLSKAEREKLWSLAEIA